MNKIVEEVWPKNKIVGEVVIGDATSGDEANMMMLEFVEEVATEVLKESKQRAKFKYFFFGRKKFTENFYQQVYNTFTCAEEELHDCTVGDAQQIIRGRVTELLNKLI